jgi:hypothetical protein
MGTLAHRREGQYIEMQAEALETSRPQTVGKAMPRSPTRKATVDITYPCHLISGGAVAEKTYSPVGHRFDEGFHGLQICARRIDHRPKDNNFRNPCHDHAFCQQLMSPSAGSGAVSRVQVQHFAARMACLERLSPSA